MKGSRTIQTASSVSVISCQEKNDDMNKNLDFKVRKIWIIIAGVQLIH